MPVCMTYILVCVELNRELSYSSESYDSGNLINCQGSGIFHATVPWKVHFDNIAKLVSTIKT